MLTQQATPAATSAGQSIGGTAIPRNLVALLAWLNNPANGDTWRDHLQLPSYGPKPARPNDAWSWDRDCLIVGNFGDLGLAAREDAGWKLEIREPKQSSCQIHVSRHAGLQVQLFVGPTAVDAISHTGIGERGKLHALGQGESGQVHDFLASHCGDFPATSIYGDRISALISWARSRIILRGDLDGHNTITLNPDRQIPITAEPPRNGWQKRINIHFLVDGVDCWLPLVRIESGGIEIESVSNGLRQIPVTPGWTQQIAGEIASDLKKEMTWDNAFWLARQIADLRHQVAKEYGRCLQVPTY